MRDSAERLSEIRIELATDLAKIEAELTEARASVSQAESAHHAAVQEWRALEALAARGGDKRLSIEGPNLTTTAEIAAPLHSLLTGIRDQLLKPAERLRGQARSRIGPLEHRRDALIDSLRQIDSALSPAGEHRGNRTLPPLPRRVAPVVEFDDIEMPREAIRC